MPWSCTPALEGPLRAPLSGKEEPPQQMVTVRVRGSGRNVAAAQGGQGPAEGSSSARSRRDHQRAVRPPGDRGKCLCRSPVAPQLLWPPACGHSPDQPGWLAQSTGPRAEQTCVQVPALIPRQLFDLGRFLIALNLCFLTYAAGPPSELCKLRKMASQCVVGSGA